MGKSLPLYIDNLSSPLFKISHFFLSSLSSMEWTRGPTIGRGSTATVSLATAIPSGELFAVKSTELSHSMFLQREQRFLSKLNSPYIVKYIGFDITNENNKPTYNLCMEYVPGGTLYDAIQRHVGRVLDEPMIRSYTRQILQGVQHLHMNGLAHCDIKSQNILTGKDGGAKIADLGCAKLVGKSGSATSAFSGTPLFMAPEVARGEEQGFEADIWAVGCTIIEMATGTNPWPEINDPVSALYRIGFSSEVPENPRWLSDKAKDFLDKCLRKNQKERWTAKELLGHPFLDELGSHVEEVKGFTMSSPCSVLNQGFWDSMQVLESPWNLTHEGTSPNSRADRIKKLIGGTLSVVSSVPNWTTWDEDWLTVRSNDSEESEKFLNENQVILVDEPLIASFGSIVYEEEIIGSSIFYEDLLLEYPIENVSTIRRGFDLACDCVSDDNIVLNNLNFETDNENSCFLHFQFLYLDAKLIHFTCFFTFFIFVLVFFHMSSDHAGEAEVSSCEPDIDFSVLV